MTDDPPASEEALRELRTWHDHLLSQVRQPIDLPEPDLRLDLESRDSERRKARHVHQMCSLHHAHFTTATRFKLPYITSMYIWAVDAENPFGLYSSARALVEFSAFTYEVGRRLQGIVARGGPWVSRGEAYFDTIVRARFGTGDLSLGERVQADAPEGGEIPLPKPIHVNDGLRSLAKMERFGSVIGDYERLCDFVHHNLSSQASTADGYFISDVAKSPTGGELRATQPGPTIRYRYPVRLPVKEAIKWTSSLALEHSRAVVEFHNSIPSTPFSSDELLDLTGSERGMDVFWPAAEGNPHPSPKTQRNAPCPCGSGMKYKRCHGPPDIANTIGSRLVLKTSGWVVYPPLPFRKGSVHSLWLA